MLAENHINCLEDTEEFCIYNSGYYHKGQKALTDIRVKINDIAKAIILDTGRVIKNTTTPIVKAYKYSKSKLADIKMIMKAEPGVYVPHSAFQPPDASIFCLNGIYQTDIKAFQEYRLFIKDPFKTFYQLPVVYNPESGPSVWDNFLEDLVGVDKINLMYEMIAYFLMPHIKYQKAFILFGPPSSGRTTFIDAILNFLGGDNWAKWISNIKLQRLDLPFQLYKLKDRVLNYFDDLEKDLITSSENFRISVTNHHLGGNIKNIQDDGSWINRIKHLFSCNEMPEIKRDPGDQFWRRWIIVPCNSEFKDKDVMTPEDYENPRVFEKNPDLLVKLVSEDAFSGLLNRVIEAWKRLEVRKKFTKEWDDIDYVSGLWMLNVNAVKLFVYECCELGVSYEVDYDVFYNELSQFRAERGVNAVTKNIMTRHLKMLNIPNFNQNKKVDKRAHPESCGRSFVGLKVVKYSGDNLEVEDKGLFAVLAENTAKQEWGSNDF